MNLKTIVCIGDSNTYGAGDEENGGSGGWVSRIARDGRRVVNLGVCGYKTTEVTACFNDAASYNPDLLIVAVGVNDARCQVVEGLPIVPETEEAAYRRDVDCLLTTAQGICDKVLVLTPFSVVEETVNPLFHPAHWYNDVVYRYSRILLEAAQKKEISCLDLHTVFPASVLPNKFGDFLIDGLHPNSHGYKVLAGLIEPKVCQLLEFSEMK